MRWWATAATCALATGAAQAREVVLYQPVPDWVKPAPAITPAQLTLSAPIIVILDTQQRLKDGQVWRYVDAATRVASPELLNQAGTISVPWQPSQGDMIVHRVEIVRGSERIDLLAGGKRFTIIRREQNLEQRELNGQLTATIPVEGLRLGDVVHTTISITNTDTALKGHVQAFAPMPSAPFRASFLRTRLLWPVADAVQWKTYATGAKPVVTTTGSYREVVVEGALPKQPELPGDAPFRFQRPPIIEATSFADWAAVSRTMAPLFATAGLIAPSSALAAEVTRIKATEADPFKRVALALDLVQDKVRYLYNGMEGGNYTPQVPSQTWSLRYGDCKAKALLLLALLHALGIEAEAVVAPMQAGDLVEGRLPSAGTFDHVLVKAKAGGETLWLDGTMTGTKLADIRDTPAIRTVLPLRTGGAALETVPFRAPARPTAEVTIDLDQRAGVTMPTLTNVTMKLRGPGAAMIGLAATQATPDQQRDMIQEMVGKVLGEVRLTQQAVAYDEASGVATLTAVGIVSTGWKHDRGRKRLSLDRAIGDVTFEPDRVRPAWRDIPVALGAPDRIRYHVTVHLPRGGKGFELVGDRELAEAIAGRQLTRSVTLTGDRIVLDDEVSIVQPEVVATAIPATRARLVLARGRKLEAVGPADLLSHATEAAEATRSGALKPLLAAYGKAIANDPEDKDVYLNRARLYDGVYDYAGAIPDLTKALNIEPAAEVYLWRAYNYKMTGDAARQLADLERAIELDPSSAGALEQLAVYRLDHGQKDAALAMLEERIQAGGKDAPSYMMAKADLLGRSGAKDAALATSDAAVTADPANAALLNLRCWLKGTLQVQIDSALADCTRSIELNGDRAAALDSRAMVYFRQGRLNEAMADLNSVLANSPDIAASLYLRGVILGQQGKTDEARGALASARLISPLIDQDYSRWGIKPTVR